MTGGQKLVEDDLVKSTNGLVTDRQAYANEVDLNEGHKTKSRRYVIAQL